MDSVSLIEKNPEAMELLRDIKKFQIAAAQLYPMVNAKLLGSGGALGNSTERAKAFRALALMDMLILKRLDEISSRLSELEVIAGLPETMPGKTEKSQDRGESPLVIDGVEISLDTHWRKIVNLVNALQDLKMIEVIMTSDERNVVKKACLERLKILNKPDGV